MAALRRREERRATGAHQATDDVLLLRWGDVETLLRFGQGRRYRDRHGTALANYSDSDLDSTHVWSRSRYFYQGS